MSRQNTQPKAGKREAALPPHHRHDASGEPPLPRIAAALKEELRQAAAAEQARPRNGLGYPFKGLNHDLLHADEVRGRRLHAQASAKILTALPGKLVRLARRAGGAIADLLTPRQAPYATHQAYRRGSPFEVPFNYDATRARYHSLGL